ncbi:MAG TPA: hypothetical protein VGN26_23550 [Armatimonadota bacterium]|jgi:hypothetical protein
MATVRVLITVKTYPIPSAKYDELVCTAGVQPDGSFIRLYPINYRDLPYSQQYRKYQWIEVEAEKHTRDPRKESYRPSKATITILGEPMGTNGGTWSSRAKFALRQKARSIEDLMCRQADDGTSLGVFEPKDIYGLSYVDDAPDWKPSFKRQLQQLRLWDDRKATKEPPRKVPYKFQYHFACDDSRCKGKHQMMIEDWEVGAYYWRFVDAGATPREAAEGVKARFLGDLCAPDRETHFYVGTVLKHPRSWIVLGVWWPRRAPTKLPQGGTLPLFPEEDLSRQQ